MPGPPSLHSPLLTAQIEVHVSRHLSGFKGSEIDVSAVYRKAFLPIDSRERGSATELSEEQL